MPAYNIDLHSHCQGDPMDRLDYTAHQAIDRAVEAGLQVLAITWHRRQFHNPDAVAYANSKGLLLIPGIETEIDGRHVVVLNAPPGSVNACSSLDDLRRLRQNPDIFILAPHPYYPHRSALRRLLDDNPDLFDGVEWNHFHLPFLPRFINPNERARAWALRYNRPLICCSDAHDLHDLGLFYSTVDAPELSTQAIFNALRKGEVQFKVQSFDVKYFFLKLGWVFWDDTRRILGIYKNPDTAMRP